MSPLYGQAAWLGESVPVHDDARLIRSADVARGVARSLPSGEALLLRGNGAVTIGMTPGLAVSRMWLLDAACAAWLAARGTGLPSPLTTEEIASWRAAGDDLLPRLWQHLRTRAGALSGLGTSCRGLRPMLCCLPALWFRGRGGAADQSGRHLGLAGQLAHGTERGLDGLQVVARHGLRVGLLFCRSALYA